MIGAVKYGRRCYPTVSAKRCIIPTYGIDEAPIGDSAPVGLEPTLGGFYVCCLCQLGYRYDGETSYFPAVRKPQSASSFSPSGADRVAFARDNLQNRNSRY